MSIESRQGLNLYDLLAENDFDLIPAPEKPSIKERGKLAVGSYAAMHQTLVQPVIPSNIPSVEPAPIVLEGHPELEIANASEHDEVISDDEEIIYGLH